MKKQVHIDRYNAAAQRVAETVEAIRTAADDADIDKLEVDFRAATAEAERCKEILEDAEELEKAETKYQKRALPANPNYLGMDDKEVREYSLVRAINAAASGDWRGAELEREASEAVARQLGRSPQGFFLPLDVQRQKRDLTAGTPDAGGYFVDTELRPQNFIEMLRNKMVVKQAGATMLTGLVGDVAIPKQSGGATYYWVAESGSPTVSQQTAAQVALTPHTGGAFTDISRKLLKQSSVDVESFVRNDLAAVCALGLDLAALHGTGLNNQPTGVAATSGIGSVVGGTDGGAPDWADVVDLETAVAVDNADIGSLAYMTNAKVRGKLKKTLVTATYGDEQVWDRRNPATPLNGYPAFVTNQVSSTLVKGTSGAICSAIFFANWADLIIGSWGNVDILVDPYTGSTSGTVRVVALQDADIALRHAESFAAMLDALTT